MKIFKKYNLLFICGFIRLPSTFEQSKFRFNSYKNLFCLKLQLLVNASQLDNCNSTEITKTYVKGWQTYVSLDNKEIRNLIKAYCDDLSTVFTVS